MRKFTVILVLVFTFVFKLFAGDGCHQHLSPEEFRAKQKAFINKGKTDKISDAQYGEIIEKVTNNRLAADRLDFLYLNRFKTLLSNRKIYLVQRAELRFHREVLKSVHCKNRGNN